ncbi:MAG: chorismate synthase [Alphaproteobacteria bacterium]|jgi:chorismate synthase|nr:chorismate synthase [Alphaproteobacteria bacterium]PPR14555.1 MAG: Chorismate synthase [Alphaproteobacteria bacterium MarineAlpha12_Bin1]|tara:strand:+ start:8783 stop:9877 length:1095 start_codon:yes stop_codon:yes gene_type:complete
MSVNKFGRILNFTTWGESHGSAIGCVIDGVPPLINLSEEDIQIWLDRRKPGQSRFTSQRKEPDKVEILSGIFENKTTGAPLSLVIKNIDARSRDYGEIADKYRPGHADYTYDAKYGIRDYRGGGRSSARETASRVAAGAIARKVLDSIIPGKVKIRSALIQIGSQSINREHWDDSEIEKNPFWCPDAVAAKNWAGYLEKIRKDGSSVGAIIEVIASGIPVGLGEPIYGKIDSELAMAMMSINAVKGVEVGEGMAAASLTGEENADEMYTESGLVKFKSNKSGGVLGGITTGQDIVVRFAVKPTSSILSERKTVDKSGAETKISTKGRHDPCVGIRAAPVGEAMMALVLADQLLRHRAQIGNIDF